MIWSRPRQTTILVSHSIEFGGQFRSSLENRGALTINLPAILAGDSPSWNDCDDAITTLDRYQGVFFSSRNSVAFLLKRIHAIDPKQIRTLTSLHLFALGDHTEDCLHDAGLFSAIVPRSSSAADLEAELLRARIWQKTYLFPKRHAAKETLPDHIRRLGASVDEVTVFQDVFPPPEEIDIIRTGLLKDKIDAVAFFDPNAISNAVELLGRQLLARTRIAVIGPSCANAARDVGLSPRIIPKQSTPESLAEEIFRALEEHP
jgi:uroporphyrinogen-III synthase